jgi:excisionase family DNA binding protein
VRTTITIPEISERLGICEETVYDMLKDRKIPNIRYGRRFIVSRTAYEHWEATIGEEAETTSIPVSRQARSPKAA